MNCLDLMHNQGVFLIAPSGVQRSNIYSIVCSAWKYTGMLLNRKSELIHCLTILHARTMTMTMQTLDMRALPAWDLLFFFVLSLLIILFVTTLGLLSLDAPRTSTSKGRSESKVNVLLGVETNDKRRDIDNLFSNATRKRLLASFSSLGS